MNKDQVKGRQNEAKGKENVEAGKTEHQDKDQSQSSKDGAVLADINEDAKKREK